MKFFAYAELPKSRDRYFLYRILKKFGSKLVLYRYKTPMQTSKHLFSHVDNNSNQFWSDLSLSLGRKMRKSAQNSEKSPIFVQILLKSWNFTAHSLWAYLYQKLDLKRAVNLIEFTKGINLTIKLVFKSIAFVFP